MAFQTVTTGDLISAADWNTIHELPYEVRNRDPGGADTAIADSSSTAVPFNGEESADRQGYFDTGGSTVTVSTAGLYDIGAGVVWEANTSGRRLLLIGAGSSAPAVAQVVEWPGSSNSLYQTVSRTVELAVDDTIEVRVFQNSGGSLNVLADRATFRTIRFVRPAP